MSVIVNAVIQSGMVKWPGLRYDGNGRPEFRFVLYRETTNAEGQTFPLSIPCCSPGATGERFATELDEGDFVVVTVGELVYRRRDTKDGEKSGLEILGWRVQKDDTALATPAAAAPSADHVEPEPDPKPRKPRLPKHLQRPWTPHGLVSEN
jgi:hypothetical protein